MTHAIDNGGAWYCTQLDDPERNIVHVYPHPDVITHIAAEDCKCIPRVLPVVRNGVAYGSTVVHNQQFLLN
jgi:hypothetical protein